MWPGVNSGWSVHRADVAAASASLTATSRRGRHVGRRIGDPAPGQRPQPRRRRDVVGVNVGFERIGELQLELLQRGEVALDRLEHRVDQHRLARRAARDQIGVGARFRLARAGERSSRALPAFPGSYLACRRRGQQRQLPMRRGFTYIGACQGTGRPRLTHVRRGKSGLHETTVPGNARRLLPSAGVRESATERTPPAFGRVRAKGCGKSAPRGRQRTRHGKPHRVQDRIGAAYGPVSARRPGWSLEAGGQPSS